MYVGMSSIPPDKLKDFDKLQEDQTAAVGGARGSPVATAIN